MGRPIKKSLIGNTSLAGQQIVVRVKIAGFAEADGYIVKQKGSRRYLVSDGTNTGICKLEDLANGSLTDGTMTVTFTKDDASTVRAKKLNNHTFVDFAGARHVWTFTASATDGAAEVMNA